jgi:hypothetical protein
MTTNSQLSSLYKSARIILWVEDSVTRDYLKELWDGAQDILFYVAGGHQALSAIVKSAENEGIEHVFALQDRDFGTSNIAKWMQKDTSRVLRPQSHEIENYLLQVEALQACTWNNCSRSESEIESKMKLLAESQVFWLALRKVLSDLQLVFQKDFPNHSNTNDVNSLLKAELKICDSDWFKQLGSTTTEWAEPSRIRSALTVAENHYRVSLDNGSWKTDFSGKEILLQIQSFIFQPKKLQTEQVDQPISKLSFNSDIAKLIARWQRENNRIPNDLVDLRAALRSRVGL